MQYKENCEAQITSYDAAIELLRSHSRSIDFKKLQCEERPVDHLKIRLMGLSMVWDLCIIRKACWLLK